MTTAPLRRHLKGPYLARAESDMGVVLTIVIILLVFPYIAGPLLLWMSGSRIPPTFFEALDSNAALPKQVEPHFWKTTHFFAANGFERAGERVRESNRTGLAAYKQLWRNPETGEAGLVGAFVKVNDAQFSNTFVAFIHECGDDGFVATTNFNPGARTLLDPVGSSKIAVATQDLAELRTLHEAHAAQHFASAVRPLRVRDGLSLCKQMETITNNMAVATKRWRHDGDTFRITLWGAVSSIYVNLPPLKWKYEQREQEMVERLRMAGTGSREFNETSRAA
jgi:hypothetical protein